jgi:hypothetical protein
MKNTSKKGKKDPNIYPRGWTRKQIDDLREHYENQSEDEAAAEIEAAFNDPHETLMAVPTELVPQIDKLVAAHHSRKQRSAAPSRKSSRNAPRRAANRRAHAA